MLDLPDRFYIGPIDTENILELGCLELLAKKHIKLLKIRDFINNNNLLHTKKSFFVRHFLFHLDDFSTNSLLGYSEVNIYKIFDSTLIHFTITQLMDMYYSK